MAHVLPSSGVCHLRLTLCRHRVGRRRCTRSSHPGESRPHASPRLIPPTNFLCWIHCCLLGYRRGRVVAHRTALDKGVLDRRRYSRSATSAVETVCKGRCQLWYARICESGPWAPGKVLAPVAYCNCSLKKEQRCSFFRRSCLGVSRASPAGALPPPVLMNSLLQQP